MSTRDLFSNSDRVIERLLPYRRQIVLAFEIATTIAAGVIAFLLRFDLTLPPVFHPHLGKALLVWIPIKCITFSVFDVHRGSWRYVSASDVARLASSNLASSAISTLILVPLVPGFPRSIYFIHLLLSILLTGGARLASRILGDLERKQPRPHERKRTFIYGAGDAGVALLREIRNNSALPYDIRGFIDDRRHDAGLIIHGTRVLGDGPALPGLARKHDIDTVLIAIPSASGPGMAEILRHCHAAGVTSKTVPGLCEIIEDRGLARQLRDVAVEDLLGRSPVRLEQDRILEKLESRTVLVTGAAGSIGSELCRQIARFSPAGIVGYEMSESALFELEQEMGRSFPRTRFFPEIGSIQNPQRLAEVFEAHRPSIVYHAAAYKHVPLMESHVFEAIENNVFGTLNVALAAGRYDVADFVMISSDKAVRPTNVMGATKRIAELVIRSLQNGGVKYVSVRFGNVLGSNGSVVPIFKQQIARGGPVTVTHPDMRRYFMTIPEASQLVLQSSTMGNGGEIFVLDMGEPVRILDLARNLILLSGLRPDHDIKIDFSGIRPGEKLFEELSNHEEGILPTYHEKIQIFAGATIPWVFMERHLSDLHHLTALRRFEDLILLLKDIVPDYNPSADLLRKALKRHLNDYALAAAEVASIQ